MEIRRKEGCDEGLNLFSQSIKHVYKREMDVEWHQRMSCRPHKQVTPQNANIRHSIICT